ncbi:MAG: T9SS type A sorting domain-containing protein [Saprospiraceae bacterium]|nr:T9SS type A sorting domain-containing protein [Saprospiraceae bacterium]MDW8482890.1 T9SS type A sorting domain-containing protein [Saprospiraceae bacterium]
MHRITALISSVLMVGATTVFAFAEPQREERMLPVAAVVLPTSWHQVLSAFEEWECPSCFNPGLLEAGGMKILLLNYSAYDNAYAEKVRAILARQLPGAEINVFWKGSSAELAAVVARHQVVVVPYPARDPERIVRAYGKVLRQYVLRGGSVIFCGTDVFGLLQHYNLFDLDFGYFCSGMSVQEDDRNHPILRETPEKFTLSNYVYPLDVSDQTYVSLASVGGYSTIGYKSLGAGKVVYIGIEYYYDEPISSQILANAVCWLCSPSGCGLLAQTQEQSRSQDGELNSSLHARLVRRVEEQLYVGTGALPTTEVKIFPNPYLEKAYLEFSLDKPTSVAIEMTNEAGTRVAILLPYRNLGAGQYRVELPNLSPGIYFVKCQMNGQNITRRVVKAAGG